MHWSKKNKLITLWLIKLQSNPDFNKIYYWHARLRSRIISQKCSIQCTGIPSRVSHHRRDWAVPTALRFVTKSFCFIHYNKALNTFIAVFLHSWVRKRCTGNSSSNNTCRNEQINCELSASAACCTYFQLNQVALSDPVLCYKWATHRERTSTHAHCAAGVCQHAARRRISLLSFYHLIFRRRSAACVFESVQYVCIHPGLYEDGADSRQHGGGAAGAILWKKMSSITP